VRLELAGEQAIAAPVHVVWERLMDHQYVASCSPDVETVSVADDTHFEVIARLGVGSVKLRFTLHVELSDLEPPASAQLSVRGEAPGSAARARCTATLVSLAPDSTRLDWAVAADLHGTVANVGARMLGGTVERISAAFWSKFAAHVKRGPRSRARGKTQ